MKAPKPIADNPDEEAAPAPVATGKGKRTAIIFYASLLVLILGYVAYYIFSGHAPQEVAKTKRIPAPSAQDNPELEREKARLKSSTKSNTHWQHVEPGRDAAIKPH